MVEQLICNQQVGGSSPSTSSTLETHRWKIEYGRVPERPKGADCKSAVYDFSGSNPLSPTTRKPIVCAIGFLFYVSIRSCAVRKYCCGANPAFQDAVFAGYTPCRHCKPTAKHDVTVSIPIYSRPREDETVQDLVALCQTAGYAHTFDGVRFCLETPVGKWKININTHPIQLQHINLVMTPHEQEYHKQPRLFLSLADVFTYIERHDSVLQQWQVSVDSF